MRWLIPLIGLVPLLAVAAFASGVVPFSRPGAPPVASAPSPTATLAATLPPAATSQPAATATPIAQATLPPAAPTSTTVAAQPTGAAVPPNATPTTQIEATTTQSPPTTTQSLPTTTQTEASGPFRSYRVQPGDTVKFVAQMYGVSSASIIQASGLRNPDQLRVGQVLTVPAKPGWLYRVQPGETLDQIAARTGIASDSIASASNLTAASVKSGDVLLIPDQRQATSK